MDRRKKTTRTTAGAAVIYLVELDADTGRWNITRNGQSTGGFARDKATAIGLAYREASIERASSNAPVTVWSVLAGKRKKEWPTAP